MRRVIAHDAVPEFTLFNIILFCKILNISWCIKTNHVMYLWYNSPAIPSSSMTASNVPKAAASVSLPVERKGIKLFGHWLFVLLCREQRISVNCSEEDIRPNKKAFMFVFMNIFLWMTDAFSQKLMHLGVQTTVKLTFLLVNCGEEDI